MNIDLSICEKGDILISKHGAILKYISPLPKEDYYDHEIEYLYMPEFPLKTKLGNGTRTNEGFVFKNNRKEEDHDIVSIIKKDRFKSIFKKHLK